MAVPGVATRRRRRQRASTSVAARMFVAFLTSLLCHSLVVQMTAADDDAVVNTPVVADADPADAVPHRRFEYKHSFKGPHLVQADGTIPFWIYSGNAIPSADQVRIVPSLKSQRGSVWAKNKVSFQHWEAEVTFRVSGRGRMGADGLAIWYIADEGRQGPVYGAADMWNGVGIFFDSFDNDGKKNNPVVLVVGNNGKHVYDHKRDGSTQALGSCLRDFRNKPYPIRARVTYYKKTLTVMINNGFTPDKDDFEFCTKVKNMTIPPEGFFGVSAATGGLADDHDVLSFLLFQLTEPGQTPPQPEAEIPKEDKDKYQEEFHNFQTELDKKKEEFQKEHPDVQGEPIDELYESVNDREIRQVFEGQNRIHLEIKQINRQLAMILDEQRRYVNIVTDEIAKRGSHTDTGQLDVANQQLGTIVSSQQDLLRNLNEFRNTFHESLRQIGTAQQQNHQQGGGGGMATYESVQHFNDIKEHIHNVRRDLEQLVQRGVQNPSEKAQKCPEVPPMPSCLSTVHFVIFIVVQSVLFLCYIMYKSQQEAAAKKFF
ncbi:protein ERGIC-53 [Corythoichthys intestinalis]|uniref:protein ERGIC-53 n=1 Tax=Corythoichthys intestinalis TaxID=161448 RepID=UPI0025A61DF3|nr:protein ERGIC-53 [Corythoichthys intestinalis]XP_061800570.1 protein ERGIC-53-like [Nerophis lumbriciformis]